MAAISERQDPIIPHRPPFNYMTSVAPTRYSFFFCRWASVQVLIVLRCIALVVTFDSLKQDPLPLSPRWRAASV